ncbi:MAG: metallophosphoesterase family protein [Acutalibacteraceae bacterium]
MKSFFSAVIAFFTVLTCFFTSADNVAELKSKGDISGFSQTHETEKELIDLKADENGDFTVLQFTDTHFTTGISFADTLVLTKMKDQINKYKPDLAVVTGDMIDDGNSGLFNKSYVLRTVAELFENSDQYWTYIPGNNDGQNYGSTSDVAAYLSKYEHCLISDDENVSGAVQYSLDILDGDQMTHSLVFLDSMDYDSEDSEHIYGYVHEDQVLWCKDEIADKKAENPDVTVSVFMHENTPAFKKAAENGEAYKAGYSTIAKSDEKYNIPKNQPLDDVFDESECVGLVAIGHVHPAVPMCSFYNGTYYHIATKTSVSSTLITIHTRENNVRSMYDFMTVK